MSQSMCSVGLQGVAGSLELAQLCSGRAVAGRVRLCHAANHRGRLPGGGGGGGHISGATTGFRVRQKPDGSWHVPSCR